MSLPFGTTRESLHFLESPPLRSQDVRRIRDGNSFATRSVAAKQEGQWTLETHVERKPRGDMQAVY